MPPGVRLSDHCGSERRSNTTGSLGRSRASSRCATNDGTPYTAAPDSRVVANAFSSFGVQKLSDEFFTVSNIMGASHGVAGMVGRAAQRPASPAAPPRVEKTRLLHGLIRSFTPRSARSGASDGWAAHKIVGALCNRSRWPLSWAVPPSRAHGQHSVGIRDPGYIRPPASPAWAQDEARIAVNPSTSNALQTETLEHHRQHDFGLHHRERATNAEVRSAIEGMYSPAVAAIARQRCRLKRSVADSVLAYDGCDRG